jgi:hypothetical protein
MRFTVDCHFLYWVELDIAHESAILHNTTLRMILSLPLPIMRPILGFDTVSLMPLRMTQA